jgi:hypothetical protein
MVAGLPLAVSQEALAELCHRHRIKRLSLFGSVLRDDFDQTSDVDVLVEFEPSVKVTYFSLSRIEDDLSGLLGRRADVHMARSLSPYLRDRVLRQARDLYVAA